MIVCHSCVEKTELPDGVWSTIPGSKQLHYAKSFRLTIRGVAYAAWMTGCGQQFRVTALRPETKEPSR